MNARKRLEQEGFAVLPHLLSPAEAASAAQSLEAALGGSGQAALRSQEGTVCGARNVLTVWPEAADIWKRSPLLELLGGVLGDGFGLVRVLYFDKPPGQTWALPWHKDMTVAVVENRLPSSRFSKPTFKAGVPHAVAPEDLLQRMLTVRLHLDAVTEENGPLKVVPGSHHDGKHLVLGRVSPTAIFAEAGDALLMRPLLAHCSGRSHEGTSRHRRILHLEFAADVELPDGYRWHTFLSARSA